MKTNPRLLSAALLAILLSSCSSQRLYAVGQGWQRNECFKIADAQERQRCLSSAATSYEQYERESRRATEPR